MKPWNGITTKTFIIYPVDSDHPLYIDDDENIFYFNDSENRFCLWCAASRLNYHLNSLRRIGVIKE